MSKKAKKNIIKRFADIVTVHIKNTFQTVMERAKDNAEANHDVTLETDWSAKHLKKKLLDYNRSLQEHAKLTKEELMTAVKEGVKQAKAAIVDDKEGLQNEEDEFFKQFTSDFEEVEEDAIGEELQMESWKTSFVDQFYAMESEMYSIEETDPVVVSHTNQDEIAALAYNLVCVYLEKGKDVCPRSRKQLEFYQKHVEEIRTLLLHINVHDYVDNINTSTFQVLPKVVEDTIQRNLEESTAGTVGMEETITETIPADIVECSIGNELCLHPEMVCDDPKEDFIPYYKAQQRIGETAELVMQKLTRNILQDPERVAIVTLVVEYIKTMQRYYVQHQQTEQCIAWQTIVSPSQDTIPFEIQVIATLNLLTSEEINLAERTIQLVRTIWSMNRDTLQTELKEGTL